MAYDFNIFKTKAKEVEDWLKKEYQSIRTGMASPAILDGVVVESYGQRMSIKQVAGVNIEDARVLRIAPWDMSQVKSIEKGILLADLGVSVTVDDKGIRVFFPELTAERRQLLLKTAKAKLEDARVSLRSLRTDIHTDIDKKGKAGGVGEDDIKRYKNDLQKMIDEGNKALEEIFVKKEKEISL